MEKIETKPEEIIEEQPKTGFLDKIRLQKKKILIGWGSFLGVLILAGAVFGVGRLWDIPIFQRCQRCQSPEDTSCKGTSCFVPKGSSYGVCVPVPKTGQEYTLEQINQMCGTTFSEVKATPTPDPTADWKTYTNTKYGYSIKFSPDWGQGIEIAAFTKDGYSLTIGPTPTELSRPPNITITTSKVKVGDRDYFKSTWKFSEGKISFERINLEREDNLEIVLMYKDGIYSKEYDQIFNLILSTFKFLPTKVLEEEGCQEDSDCEVDTCKCKAVNKKYLDPEGKICQRYCPGEPVCYKNRCILRIPCEEPRPEVCTMECLVNPPYICGSDGKSYCTECQACANLEVEWYVIQDEPCSSL